MHTDGWTPALHSVTMTYEYHIRKLLCVAALMSVPYFIFGRSHHTDTAIDHDENENHVK